MRLEDFVSELDRKNELRKAAHLPVYDRDKVIREFREDEVARARSAFMGHCVRQVLDAMPPLPEPRCWSEAQGRFGRWQNAQRQVQDDADGEWAVMLESGTWKNWLE